MRYRRHPLTCPHRNKSRHWRKCHCAIHLEGYLGNKYVRESLGIRSWDVAQAKVRELEAEALFPEEKKQHRPKFRPRSKNSSRMHEDGILQMRRSQNTKFF